MYKIIETFAIEAVIAKLQERQATNEMMMRDYRVPDPTKFFMAATAEGKVEAFKEAIQHLQNMLRHYEKQVIDFVEADRTSDET